ncbi:hypothetical protein FQA47_009253 [Oryzias melastigma]|uniref:Uncharacterized protein n=1 Tax=Oryzias melastigma TaxID=30732 RepID=A0A834CM09_ORYME|nr:hypothetical protein FQA47_009253 [Oryzias melastigma]
MKQRLQAPEGSPARSLDTRARGDEPGSRADSSWRIGQRRVGQEGSGSAAEDTSVSEGVDWWVGLRRPGRLRTQPPTCFLRGIHPIHAILLMFY